METQAGRGTTLRWILCVTLPTEVVLLGFISFLVQPSSLSCSFTFSPAVHLRTLVSDFPVSFSSSLFLCDSPTDRSHSGNSAANIKWKWILATSVTDNSEGGRWFAPATFAEMFVSWSHRAADSRCSHPSPFADGFFFSRFTFLWHFSLCSPFKHAELLFTISPLY